MVPRDLFHSQIPISCLSGPNVFLFLWLREVSPLYLPPIPTPLLCLRRHWGAGLGCPGGCFPPWSKMQMDVGENWSPWSRQAAWRAERHSFLPTCPWCMQTPWSKWKNGIGEGQVRIRVESAPSNIHLELPWSLWGHQENELFFKKRESELFFCRRRYWVSFRPIARAVFPG